jgi:hypothetical protein
MLIGNERVLERTRKRNERTPDGREIRKEGSHDNNNNDEGTE